MILRNKALKLIYFGFGCCLLFILFVPQQGYSEIYQGIMPLDTLGDIKAKFPNATFEKKDPAWAAESDALYFITGEGLTGLIVVKFTDERPYWKSEWDKIPPDKVDESSTNQQFIKSHMDTSDEESLTVNWVRWVPPDSMPLERYITKYGKPEKSGFADDTMEPYREWTSKGVTVILNDDGKHVKRVDYSFTKAELRHAYKSKFGQIPEFLQEKSSPKKISSKKREQ